MTCRLTLSALAALLWSSRPSPADEPAAGDQRPAALVCPERSYLDGVLEICVPQSAHPVPAIAIATPTYPVRFESKREYRVAARAWDAIDDQPLEPGYKERFGPAPECTTPCTLNLPAGRVRVSVKAANERSFSQSIQVPPRASVATLGLSSLAWASLVPTLLGLVLEGLGTPVAIAASSCGRGDCAAPIAADVALWVGGAALVAVGISLLVIAVRRGFIPLRDASGHAERRRARFSALGLGPAQSPGLSLGFSF